MGVFRGRFEPRWEATYHRGIAQRLEDALGCSPACCSAGCCRVGSAHPFPRVPLRCQGQSRQQMLAKLAHSKLDLLLLHCLVLKKETGLACGSRFYYSLPAFYRISRAKTAHGARKHRWEFMSACVGFPCSAAGLDLVPAHLCPAALSVCHTYSTTRLLPLRGWELSERSQQLPSNCSLPGASASPETGPGLFPGCPALHGSRVSDQGEPSSPAVQMRPLLLYVISGSSRPRQFGFFISHYFSDVYTT